MDPETTIYVLVYQGAIRPCRVIKCFTLFQRGYRALAGLPRNSLPF